jgi:hypothetical protein
VQHSLPFPFDADQDAAGVISHVLGERSAGSFTSMQPKLPISAVERLRILLDDFLRMRAVTQMLITKYVSTF